MVAHVMQHVQRLDLSEPGLVLLDTDHYSVRRSAQSLLQVLERGTPVPVDPSWQLNADFSPVGRGAVQPSPEGFAR